MSQTSILLIDVGNSRLKFALWDRARAATHDRRPPLPVLALPAAEPVNWSVVGDLCREHGTEPIAGLVAGANDAALNRVRSTWPWSGAALGVVTTIPPELLRTNVDVREQVGLDRLLNAIAVNVWRSAGRPAVVISAGTATTVDWLDDSGTFCGGAILPGLGLGALALHQYTARLPLVDVGTLPAQPPVRMPGRNTESAIRNGLWWGHLGAIRELVHQLSAPSGPSPQMYVTGGNGRPLSQALGSDYRFEADLALRGLAVLAERSLPGAA